MPNGASISEDNSAFEIDPATLEPEIDPESGIDVSLIRMNLAMSPWQRLLANDDMVNFGDSLRAAMTQTHATAPSAT